MKVRGFTCIKFYFVPGEEVALDSLCHSRATVNEKAIGCVVHYPDYAGGPRREGTEQTMPTIAPGDMVTLTLGAGKLSVRVSHVAVHHRLYDAPDDPPVYAVSGEGEWDGAYYALRQGVCGWGTFHMDIHPESIVAIGAYRDSVPYCIYQAASCLAEEANWQAGGDVITISEALTRLMAVWNQTISASGGE